MCESPYHRFLTPLYEPSHYEFFNTMPFYKLFYCRFITQHFCGGHFIMDLTFRISNDDVDENNTLVSRCFFLDKNLLIFFYTILSCFVPSSSHGCYTKPSMKKIVWGFDVLIIAYSRLSMLAHNDVESTMIIKVSHTCLASYLVA